MNKSNTTTATSYTTEYAQRYYANLYSPEYTGFYFSDLDEYQAQAERMQARGCEEWEIDYIDGDLGQLFRAAGVTQCNVEQWFTMLDELEPYQYKQQLPSELQRFLQNPQVPNRLSNLITLLTEYHQYHTNGLVK